MKTFFLFLAFAACFTASKKGGGITPPAVPKSFADFIKNTEWVGTLERPFLAIGSGWLCLSRYQQYRFFTVVTGQSTCFTAFKIKLKY
jgi:hypothetical protein